MLKNKYFSVVMSFMENRALILDYIAMSVLKRHNYLLFPHKVVSKVQKSSSPEGRLDFEIPS
jgi:hypothetical protein